MDFHLPFFLFLFFSFIAIAGGFEVELIHRDSPLSPLYNSTATPGERARGAALRSLARLNRMTSRVEETIEPIITTSKGEFLMALLIGTPPLTTYAIMDTGSDLIWIKCPPCFKCFPQNAPLFDPTKSTTYTKVDCDSPICQAIHPTNINCTIPSEECMYTYGYGDGSSTTGVLATESFGFQTVKRGVGLTVHDIVFGCGNDNKGTFAGGSGIIGLGRGSLSLISQVRLKMRRFSYCLPKSAEISSTFKFGVSASFSGKKVVSTPMINDESNPSYYYVKLEGITIGGKKIAAKELTSGNGNTLVDSGTTLNLLEPQLHSTVVGVVIQLISLPTVQDPTMTYETCYQTMSLMNISVPTFTYHFTGADIELKNLNIFTSFGDISCLAIGPSNQDFNIYGNVAQKNFEVEYNLESNVISFAPAECYWKGVGVRAHSYSLVASSFCILIVSYFVLLI